MSPSWKLYTFRPPQPPPDRPRTPVRRNILFGAGALTLLGIGVSIGVFLARTDQDNSSQNSQMPNQPAASASPFETPTSTITLSPEPTNTTPITANPTPTPEVPSPSQSGSFGLPSVAELGGSSLKFVADSTDKSRGTFIAKARTSNDFNLLSLRCEDGAPFVQLHVVDEGDKEIGSHPEFGYPEAVPNPCNGNTVKAMSESMTRVSYETFLAAALINEKIS